MCQLDASDEIMGHNSNERTHKISLSYKSDYGYPENAYSQVTFLYMENVEIFKSPLYRNSRDLNLSNHE